MPEKNLVEMHIGISYQEGVPPSIIDKFIDNISVGDISLTVEKRPITPYAAMEWVVPSVIFAYLSKSYFDAFLKEAGKDHYILLKNSLAALFKVILGKKPEDRPRVRSLLFSILSQSHEGVPLKFIFPEGVSHEKYEIILSELLILLMEHHSKFPNDRLTLYLDIGQPLGRTFYLEYSVIDEKWVLINPATEMMTRP